MLDRRSGHGLLALVILLSQLPPAWCGETPLVDKRQTSSASSVSQDQIGNLPTGRSYADLLNLVPGITSNKASRSDSVNWARTPMPDQVYDSLRQIDPNSLNNINILSSPYKAEYGRVDSDAFKAASRFAGEFSGFTQYYLNDLAGRREWPGEAAGANGMVMATGDVFGKPVAIIYDADGYPMEYYTAKDLENVDGVMNDLHDMCFMISSGKVSVGSGKLHVSSGKIETTSGKITLDNWGDIMFGRYGSYDFGMGPISYVNPPAQYKLNPDFKYLSGGGMEQIDAPVTTPISDNTGGQPNQAGPNGPAVVNDQTVIDGVNKQKDKKVRDAINQYLNPQGGGQQQPQQPQQPQQSGNQNTPSIVDDLRDDLNPLNGHPAPQGEPKTTDNKDGSSTRAWPDGSKETTWPDGRQDVTYPDGSKFTRGADGAMTDTFKDGSTVTRDKTGKETGRTPAAQPQTPTQPQPTAPTQQGTGSSGSNSGVVDDKTVRDAVDKQKNQKVKDAINQYLTPQGQSGSGSGSQQQPQSGSGSTKPRSRLPQARRWLTALANWLTQEAQAAGSGLWSASTTDASGTTTAFQKQPDGTVTRTVTDRNGQVTESGPVQKDAPTKLPPRDKVTRASTRDENGNTVTVEKQKDGTTTRTVTDPSGNILERAPVTAPEPSKAAPRVPGTTRASATDANGNTTTIEKHADGSSTVTVTDAKGNVVSQGPLTAPEPTKIPPRERTTQASARDANGNTVTIEKKPGGSTTRTVTDPSGKVLESGPVTQPEPTKVPPPNRTTSVSTTDSNGNTTTISRNPDGSMTRTVTDRNGKVTESGQVPKDEPTKVPPRDHTTSVSTRDSDGNTTTISRNPDGSMTRTVTDRNGKVTERSQIPKEEPTRVAPRKPATEVSAQNPDGTTTTLTKQPDGSTLRTVTDGNGNIIERGPIDPPAVTKAPPRKPGTARASTTDTDGNTLTIERNPDGTVTRTLTDRNGNVLGSGPMSPPAESKPSAKDPVVPDVRTSDAQGNRVMLQPQPNGTVTEIIKDPSGAEVTHGTMEPITPAQPGQPATTPQVGQIYDFTKPGSGKSFPYDQPFDNSVLNNYNRSFGGEITYPGHWNSYLTGNYARENTQPAQGSKEAGSSYKDQFLAGLESEIARSVSLGVRYTHQDTPHNLFADDTRWPASNNIGHILGSNGPNSAPYPFIESGLRISDYMYTNLGVYPHGQHPILGQIPQAAAQNANSTYSYLNDRWQLNDHWSFNLGARYGQPTGSPTPKEEPGKTNYFSPNFQGFQQGFNYTPGMGQTPRTHNNAIGTPGGFPQLQGFNPKFVGVLPYGCDHPAKVAIYEDLKTAVAGRMPVDDHVYLWEPVYGRVIQGKKDAPAASVTPNDPLYAHGSTAEQAAMKMPPQPREISHGPDMSMAAPPEAGPSPIAEAGLKDRTKKGPTALDQWGLFATGFTPQGQGKSAWDLVDTSKPNTIVAVIDSGLDLSHPDGPEYLWANPGEIAGNGVDDDKDGYVDDVHGWNFNDENSDLTDYKGHGTLVAGIIAARRNNGIGIAGINPGARIMVLKVTNKFGQTNSLAIFRAIHYAVKHGARVINLSLGGAGVSKLEQLAINFAHAHGAVVVVAAGNEAGDAAKSGPAAARRAITVAGLDMDRSHTKLSNEGTVIAIAAPGQNIYSLQSKDAEWPGPAFERERQYRTATGTSFSAPMVAATASLIFAKQPNLPNVLVEDMLLNSTRPLGEAAWNDSTGWGLLNAADALSMNPAQLITIWPNEVVVDKKQGGARVYGTIRGVFSSYHLDVGKGKQPREWQSAGGPISRPVTQGLIGEVSGLKGVKEAVIRITAEGANGATKVAYVPVQLK